MDPVKIINQALSDEQIHAAETLINEEYLDVFLFKNPDSKAYNVHHSIDTGKEKPISG